MMAGIANELLRVFDAREPAWSVLSRKCFSWAQIRLAMRDR